MSEIIGLKRDQFVTLIGKEYKKIIDRRGTSNIAVYNLTLQIASISSNMITCKSLWSPTKAERRH